jgi:hypothetical protein
MSKLIAAWLLEDLVRKPRFNFGVSPQSASINAPAEPSVNHLTKPVSARHPTGSRGHPPRHLLHCYRLELVETLL